MEQSTGEKSNSDPLVPKDTGDNICMLVDGVVLNSQSIADLQHANMTLRDNNNQIMDLLRQITQDFADMRAKKNTNGQTTQNNDNNPSNHNNRYHQNNQQFNNNYFPNNRLNNSRRYNSNNSPFSSNNFRT